MVSSVYNIIASVQIHRRVPSARAGVLIDAVCSCQRSSYGLMLEQMLTTGFCAVVLWTLNEGSMWNHHTRISCVNGYIMVLHRAKDLVLPEDFRAKYRYLGAWISNYTTCCSLGCDNLSMPLICDVLMWCCRNRFLHKSHNAPVPYPTMHHFVTEMCTQVHICVTKWCIVGYLSDALWDLWDGSIMRSNTVEACELRWHKPWM